MSDVIGHMNVLRPARTEELPLSATPPVAVTWGHDALTVTLVADADGPLRLAGLAPGPRPDRDRLPAGQPLVELLVAGRGRARSGYRYSDTAVGQTLRYLDHTAGRAGDLLWLDLALHDPVSALRVLVRLEAWAGVPAFRATTTVTNDGPGDIVLHAVSSLCTGAFVPDAAGLDDLDLLTGAAGWLAENRWQRRPLRPGLLPDLGLDLHGQDGHGCLPLTSQGTWSSGRWLPTGGLVDTRTGRGYAWQVEHNGGWHCELGDRRDGLYLAVFGPTEAEHQWWRRLGPGESFRTVPASVAVGDGGWDAAVAALTAHRRATRRPHPDNAAMPVVCNDYMNTLMGDPTTEKLLPLVAAAAGAGAECFCVDAGWYDDEDGDWWDSVGEWQPSKVRFPDGIGEVLDAIRAAGMVPGLWLEPEVVGVRSPVAQQLPAEAFFQRSGQRQLEQRRYQLDLRHPAARTHLDGVVDRLVAEHGIGYLKLDYNINPGTGTEVAADSAGDGLLGHNRAHLAWLDGVLDRHPGLVLENCGSGAMRADQAMLSRLQLQSTSDQQDPLRCPPIAAAAPASMPPEQAANWAYPQPDMDDELIAFTLCTGLLGRLYLSGRLDAMTQAQRALVADAVAVHKGLRADIAGSVPVWPLGLPGWSDGWVALALRTPARTHLTLWRRPGAPAAVALPFPYLAGRPVRVQVAYPGGLPRWPVDWDAGAGVLRLTATSAPPAARTLTLVPDPPT
jgi:alpha-galactosidase